jgi:hypothetical protein
MTSAATGVIAKGLWYYHVICSAVVNSWFHLETESLLSIEVGSRLQAPETPATPGIGQLLRGHVGVPLSNSYLSADQRACCSRGVCCGNACVLAPFERQYGPAVLTIAEAEIPNTCGQGLTVAARNQD